MGRFHALKRHEKKKTLVCSNMLSNTVVPMDSIIPIKLNLLVLLKNTGNELAKLKSAKLFRHSSFVPQLLWLEMRELALEKSLFSIAELSFLISSKIKNCTKSLLINKSTESFFRNSTRQRLSWIGFTWWMCKYDNNKIESIAATRKAFSKNILTCK